MTRSTPARQAKCGRTPRRFLQFFAPILLGLLACAAYGQQLTGTLSGTVYDQSGAVVPNADVSLKNETSNDTRHTVSNSDGYFHFAAVPPGSYSVTIVASGFQSWSATGIAFGQGDNRTMPNISLQVGSTTQSVQVVTEAEAVAPTDTGEVAASLNAQMVNDIAIQGRDAGELIKIMPGMAFNNGLSQGSGFTDRVVGSSGPGRLFVQRSATQRFHVLYVGRREPGRSRQPGHTDCQY